MDNAIRPLLKEDINKINYLIEALKRIKNNESSRETTKILNKVEKYLQEWLNNTDTSESLEEEITSPKSSFNLLEEVVNKAVDVVQEKVDEAQKAVKIIIEINFLGANQRKELIVLGYFLQGELEEDPEAIEYMKNVLRSYLATIEQFRSSPRSQ